MTSSWRRFWLIFGGRRNLNGKLFCAAGRGDAAQVESLLDQGADANADDGWDTVLGWAGRSPKGNAATVRLLLERGACVNGNPKRRTIHPFVRIAHSSTSEIIRLLVEHGADVNALEKRVVSTGCTAFQALVNWADVETVEFLLDCGVDINKRGLGRQGTALHFAAGNGRPDVVNLLLRRGADINAVDTSGRTALNWAEDMLSRNSMLNHSYFLTHTEKAEQYHKPYQEVTALLKNEME